MELIPILSTIILVATISTFLLAIGAYILYKVRERKGLQAEVAEPAQVEAELVSPAAVPAQSKKKQQSRQEPEPAFMEAPKPVPAFQRRQSTMAQPYQAPAAAGPMHSGYVQRTPRFTTYQAGVMDFSGQQAGRRYGQQPGQYSGTGFVPLRGFQGQDDMPTTLADKKFKDSRFLKYTTDGYIPAKTEKESGALKWK